MSYGLVSWSERWRFQSAMLLAIAVDALQILFVTSPPEAVLHRRSSLNVLNAMDLLSEVKPEINSIEL
jgi:hypothetical protein